MGMKRTVEPELMSEFAQARAYAEADFEAPHSSYVKLFAEKFPRRPNQAFVLDLGCGPCDVTIRFAKANPGCVFHAVDGSAAMLRFGRAAIRRNRLSRRFRLVEGFIPGAPVPRARYDVILSSSFLHHLHDPHVLWETVRTYSRRGTRVFVVDLRRPPNRVRARFYVEKYSGNEPVVAKRDFYNSLLAAFTPAEIRRQLKKAGLGYLKVESTDDRHLVVFGSIR